MHQLAATLTESQFHAPPRGGGWSVGYCMEHLVLSGRVFLAKWDEALERAARERAFGESPNDAVRPYRWWQRKVLEYAENPARLKHKTPALLEPFSRHSIEETLTRFFEMHRDLVHRLDASRNLDVRQTRVQSPFIGWPWFELGFSFDLCLAHERRHLNQAWRVSQEVKRGVPAV